MPLKENTMLRQTATHQELVTPDGKVYEVRLSIGVKSLLVERFTETYIDAVKSNPAENLALPAEYRDRIMSLLSEVSTAETDERREELQQEIKDLTDGIMDMPGPELEALSQQFSMRLANQLEKCRYDLLSVMLTQRDCEGRITEFVSPAYIQFSTKFDDLTDDLDKLLDLAFAAITDLVKKTPENVKKFQQTMESLVSVQKTL